MNLNPLVTGSPEFHRLKNPLYHQMKRAKKQNQKENSSDRVTNTAGSSSSSLHRLNTYVHLPNAVLSFIFPVFLLFFPFFSSWNEFSSIFVYLCVSVHGIRGRRKGGEELVSMMCRVWWGTDFSSPGFSSVSFPSSMFPRVHSLTERWGRRIERIKE